MGAAALSSAKTRTFTNRSDRPYPAGDFEVSDTLPSTQKYPTTTLVVGDITFTWEGRDRTLPGVLFQNDAGVEETGNGYLLTIFNNTVPASPVQMRQVGTGATGTNADATALTVETYVWTAAQQLNDDAAGTVTAIRVDLRTHVESTTTLFSRVDVIRTFTRTPA